MAIKPTYKELEQKIKALEKESDGSKWLELKLKDTFSELQRFREAMDHIPAFVYMKDPQSRYVYANRLTLELFGCSAEELVGCDDTRFFPPDTVKRLREVDSLAFSGGQTSEEIDVANAGAKRRVYWEVKTPIYVGPERKTIWGLLGISTDITERKQAEETLRQRTHNLGERVKELNCLYGISNLVEKPDISLEEIFQGLVDLIPPSWQYPEITCSRIILEDKEYKTENFKETNWKQSSEIFVTGKRVGVLELCYLEEKPEINEGPFLKEERSLIDAITERLGHIIERIQAREEQEGLEAQLQEVQKKEAIATLVGGIAHEFNNALSSITAHTGLLEMEYHEDEKIMGYAKAMKQSAHRMARLTRQLLAYSREGSYNPQTRSLTNFVEGALSIIQHLIDPDIRVETDLPLDVMNVEVDLAQMQMVLSAIVVNSNEAIDPPGRIRISARNMDLDKEFAKDHPGLEPGPYACLSIEDDGKGMDEETRSRIFDPFFTTHFIGRGLGMASAYGIVKNHDGAVTVDSEIGRGTVVKIYLPAIEAKEEVKKRCF